MDHKICIDDIVLWDENPHEGDVGALMVDIAEYGYNRTISIHENNVVFAGNTTATALKRLYAQDKNNVPANVELQNGKWFISYTPITHLDNDQARGYGLADNRVGSLGRDDPERVLAILRDLEAKGLNIEPTGYDRDDLDDLINWLHHQDESHPDHIDDGEDDYDDDDFLPVIRVQVSDHHYAVWQSLLASAESPREVMESLLSSVD